MTPLDACFTGGVTQHESDVDTRISALASGQHLCFSRSQAIEAGASLSLIKRRLRAGRWTTCHPGVYSLAVSPDPWLQRIWAAWLAVGRSCAVSHSTAAALHRLVGHPRTHRIELIAQRSSHPRVQGVVVHQFDDLRPHHVVANLPACPRLPVTTPNRTVVDLAVRAGPSRLRAVITDGVAAGRLTVAGVALVLGDVARRGKPGVRQIGGVLDELTGEPVPASVAESTFLAVLDDHGVRRPETQVVLPGRGAVVGRGRRDLPRRRRSSSRSTAGGGTAGSRTWRETVARDAEAARAGYLTLRFMFEHIVADADWVAATVAAVVESRSLRRAS